MAYQWPLDKLATINSALTLCGDNTVNVADDGSDEWNVGSPAYERGLGYAIESHSWGFTTQAVVLQPSATAPQDTSWDTAYPIPEDCVHIIWLKINDNSQASPPNNTTQTLTLYDIMGTPTGPVIVTNAQGGPPPPIPPITPSAITLKYVSNSGPLADPTFGTPTLVLALQTFVMAGIYSGLHEEPDQGRQTWKDGELMLQKARTRYDQQKPKRQFFNSRITAARRVRRPWPRIGNNDWGGSGTPG